MKRDLKAIIRAVLADRQWHDYNEVLRAVFPPKEFPNAWRYKAGGGPPGCAMAFGRALRELKVSTRYKGGSSRDIALG